MIEETPPRLIIHKGTGVRLAGWKLPLLQLLKVSSAKLFFLGVIPFRPNAVEVDAECVLRGRAANLPVPATIVPSNTQIEMTNSLGIHFAPDRLIVSSR